MGPSFVRAIPTKFPILLLAEPGLEEEWSHGCSVLNEFLSIYPDRHVNLLIASSLPGFLGSMAKWIDNDPFYANWIIELTTEVSGA